MVILAPRTHLVVESALLPSFSWGVPPSGLMGNVDLRITFDKENSQNLERTVLTGGINADQFFGSFCGVVEVVPMSEKQSGQ